MKFRNLIWLLALALGALPGAALAQASAPERIVYVVVTKGKVNPKILGKVKAELTKASKLMGAKLIVPPGKAAAAKVSACGSDLSCVVKIGKPSKASRIVYARASMVPGGGVKFGFLTIKVRGASIEGKVGLTLKSPAIAKKELDAQAFSILGAKEPGQLEVRGAKGAVLVDGAKVGGGAGPFEIPVGTHRVQADGQTRMIRFAPGRLQVFDVRRRALLFVIAPPSVSKPAKAAVRSVLSDLAGKAGTIGIVPPAEMVKAFAKNPKAAITRCGKKLICIGGLGAKVGVESVIYARLAPGKTNPRATRMQFLVVSSQTKKVERKIVVEVGAGANPTRVLEQKGFEILGVKGSGRIEVENAVDEVLVDGKPVGRGPGPHEVALGRHKVTSHGKSESLLFLPGKTLAMVVAPPATPPTKQPTTPDIPPPDEVDPGKTGTVETITAVKVEIDSPPDGTEPPPGDEVAVAVAPEASTTPETQGPSTDRRKRLSFTTYTGLAVGGVGLALAGTGSLFATQSEAKNTALRDIRDGVTPGTQLEATRLMNEAQSSAGKANLMFISGGVSVGLGLALMSIDLFRSGGGRKAPKTPEAAVVVGPDGAYFVAQMRW